MEPHRGHHRGKCGDGHLRPAVHQRRRCGAQASRERSAHACGHAGAQQGVQAAGRRHERAGGHGASGVHAQQGERLACAVRTG